MRAYGIPRFDDVEFPDVEDCKRFGLPSHVGKFPEKCGCFKPYTRSAGTRKKTRRYWKRKERAGAKKICRDFV